MTDKPKVSQEESKLFRESVNYVRPLKRNETLSPRDSHREVQTSVRQCSPEEKQASNFSFSDHEYLAPVTGNDSLHFTKPGLQTKVIRRLMQGKLGPEARLDLHGMIIEEAKEALGLFLLACEENDIRRVIIIHGKGHIGDKPILKNKINHWLREYPTVLAFHSAKPRDGGTGAVYVLLSCKRG